MKLQDARAVARPGIKEEGRIQEDQDRPLDDIASTQYRAIVARRNNPSPDRFDTASVAKELAFGMASPKTGDLTRPTRLGRHYVGKPRLKQWSQWQPAQYGILIYSDADWAGRQTIRKQITGRSMMKGNHATTGWSKTQTLVALSPGESELSATVRAAAETLGTTSCTRITGCKCRGKYGKCAGRPWNHQ